MHVTQITPGRFHHFHLARQLEKNNLLNAIWTGYPLLKLKDELGIPKGKIKSYPWFQVPFMSKKYVGLGRWSWLNKELAWMVQDKLDKHVAKQLEKPTQLIALSGSGLHSGKRSQELGGYHICDRGSSHIRYQDVILREEHSRWGLDYKGIDPRIIAKEEAEYEQADLITVPSEFSKESFIKMGVDPGKIAKVVYGARLDRFYKNGDPDKNSFTVLWVGAISLRKGFFDLLEAFQELKHPFKKLIVIGEISNDVKKILDTKRIEQIEFKGNVPNHKLIDYYSTAHVFVFPSIEDGFGMVQGEAMACGCPVIASENTGAKDLFTDGKEGFIVPIRSSGVIKERLQQLADDEDLRSQMSEACIERVKLVGGWDSYGTNMVNSLSILNK